MATAPTEPAGPPEFRPHVFGKFYLLQRLAVGGMAEIFRAKVVGAGGFEKELVLKRVLPARSQDRQFIQMLVNEAKLTAQITHGNVVQIYECGAVDGLYFIAMELVHGASLQELLRELSAAGGSLTPEQAIYLVVQLLQGLSYAHRRTDADGAPLQIVHCDVSPENVLVGWEGEVKLLDFGIARAATGLSNHHDGVLMGKLGYVAPEQAAVEQRWDHRVDLFAAGVLLYELLTGKKPFPQAADVDGVAASRRTPVPAPSSVVPRLPRELDAIVARALAFDPDDRFPDARAFADALVDVLFPTPHSAIQESLAVSMRTAFAARIARERAARAHDALVMKVLENSQRPGGAAARGSEAMAGAPPPSSSPELTPIDRAVPRAPVPVFAQRRARAATFPIGRALAIALVAASVGVAGALAVERKRAEGTILVTSEPAGATVSVDGVAAPGATPLAVEGLRLAEPHAVAVSAPDRLTATTTLPPERRSFREVHVKLAPALAAVRVESVPSGAQVKVDGRPAGTTPVSVPGLRIDERHRIDLALPGHELDQFVVRPDEDGTRFRRVLAPRAASAR